MLALEGLFSRPDIFNKISRTLNFNHRSHFFRHGLSITCQFYDNIEKLMRHISVFVQCTSRTNHCSQGKVWKIHIDIYKKIRNDWNHNTCMLTSLFLLYGVSSTPQSLSGISVAKTIWNTLHFWVHG